MDSAYLNMTAIGAQIGSGGVAKETPRAALLGSVKMMSEAVGASGRLREQMCGPWALPVAKCDEAERAPSFFGDVEDAAKDIERMASEILAHISAIQSRV